MIGHPPNLFNLWLGAVYGVMTLSPEAQAYCDGKSVIFRMVEYPNVVVSADTG